MVTLRKISVLMTVVGLFLGCPGLAQAAESSATLPAARQPKPRDEHAYHAPVTAFPSHQFQLAPRWHETPQLALHFGLLQPIALQGFNAAIDVRWGPMLASYSHGQGLNYSANGGLGLGRDDKAADLGLRSPWTTGGGIGVVLLDELYVMADFKVHRYEATLGDKSAAYTTVSVGGELGYRLFAWRGLFLQSMLRYWPNVYTSLPSDQVKLGNYTHQAKNLNLFVNLSLGWAFEV